MRNEVIKQKIKTYNTKVRQETAPAQSRNQLVREAFSTNNLISKKEFND